MDIFEIALLIASLLGVLAAVILLCAVHHKLKISSAEIIAVEMEKNRLQQDHLQQTLRNELAYNVQTSIKNMGEVIAQNQLRADQMQSRRFLEMDRNLSEKQESLSKTVHAFSGNIEQRLKTFELSSEQKMENMRQTIEQRLAYIQEDNNNKLDAMRKTVDEKLQKTLDERMTQSFQLVNERLEQVYRGLGEMQTLATGVGDLKKVLSGVKTRGILGEIQLGSILKEILSPEQYEVNIATRPNSKERVEFAIKLPAEDEGYIYLPIDAKFPADAYANLQNANETGSTQANKAAFSIQTSRIRKFAKEIHDKYIEPPYTTEFGILFLPFEGLYAEVVSHGLVETLQREYKINIAGPSTMAALLNSLQMGFKTLAIQKRSGEVWNILGAVKTEFDKFSDILLATQQRLNQANDELDKLVGVRTRAIQKKLRNVQKLGEDKSEQLLQDSFLEE